MNTHTVSRRTVLRGLLGGTAVAVGLPVLESFLNTNGTAYAATGAPLPPCFGTWFWGLGLTPHQWEPTTTGTGYALPEHIASLRPVKEKINLFSGMQIFLDGKVNQNHYSGAQGQATGAVSRNSSDYTTSLDSIIADQIGTGSRFRSLEATCDGDSRVGWSARGSNGLNPSETSPLGLYTRIFSDGFRDPNAADFTPDPSAMVRHSVLSAVAEQRRDLMNAVSASDRARLDEYFSSVRDLEQKLAFELEPPAPLPSCSAPSLPTDEVGSLVPQVASTHQQFAQLMAHALSCGQTRVFNLALGSAFSRLRTSGEPSGYHALSHEEPVDAKLGYQPKCKWLAEQCMGFFVELVQTLDSIQEGDHTLLDRTVVFAFTDHGEARMHSMKRLPVITAGSGGGRMRTGHHIAAEGDTATRVGFTVQQAFGVASGSWGTESNEVSRPFSDVLA
jgi:hypothetical protein